MDDKDIEDIINGSSKDSDMDELKKCVAELMKRFDCVQIFASRHEADSGGTVNCHFGSGNWFARYGQVKQWTLIEDRE
jgi:hypothetical protein